MIEEESKSVRECTSPSQQISVPVLNDSSSKGEGAQSSSSRRNHPVPLLNLANLSAGDKHQGAIHLHEERKHDSTVPAKTLFERHAF
jgi:hypothetical protein